MPTHKKDILQDVQLLLQNEQYASLGQYLKAELPKLENKPSDLTLSMLDTLANTLHETHELADQSLKLYESTLEKKARLLRQLKSVIQEIVPRSGQASFANKFEASDFGSRQHELKLAHQKRPPLLTHLWYRLKNWLLHPPVDGQDSLDAPDTHIVHSQQEDSAGAKDQIEDSIADHESLAFGNLVQEEVQPYDHSIEDKKPNLAFYCLGAFRVYQDDQAINNWKSNKGVAILKYLVAHNPKPISKEMLMDIFWPDSDLESARRNLHQAVYSLRQALRINQPELQHIRYENDSYSLNPDISQWIDFEEYEHRVQNGRRLEVNGRIDEALKEFGIAEGLYQGGFLEENLYDDWAIRKREYLQTQYLSLTIRLIRHYHQRKEFTAAIALCHKRLSLDPSYEPAHRHLIRCLLAQGQRHLAARQYQTCVQVLKDELGLEPDAKTAALYHQIDTIPQSGQYRGISAD